MAKDTKAPVDESEPTMTPEEVRAANLDSARKSAEENHAVDAKHRVLGVTDQDVADAAAAEDEPSEEKTGEDEAGEPKTGEAPEGE